MQTKLVLVALAASVSASVNYMAALNVARDDSNLFPRQTIDAKCLSAVEQIASSVPTPPPAVMSQLLSNTQTDPCKFTVPASLSKDFSSYESQLSSFASKNSDLINSCTNLAKYNTVTDCKNSSPTGTAAAAGTTKNAGARETGMAMAAVAAAGFAFAAI